MRWLDLRYGGMFLMNLVKLFMGPLNNDPWDAFGVTTTCNTFLVTLAVFLLLSFYSIKVSLTAPCPVEVRFQNFSPIVLLSLFLSLILPQRACWLYFLILWLSSFEFFSAMIDGSVRCLGAVLSRVPGCNVGAAAIDLEMGQGIEGAAAYLEEGEGEN